MEFKNTEVWGFEHAIRGMRNPKESWAKSDSFHCDDSATFKQCQNCPFHNEFTEYGCSMVHSDDLWVLGNNDKILMQKLIKAGTEHRKFMRQIFVSVDITAPCGYWWNEFDTYKIGTVANSTSKMHKILSKPITKERFECPELVCDEIVEICEDLRRQTIKHQEDKRFDLASKTWKKLIVNLPGSWLQTRTVTMNYENVLNMVKQRKHHKLTEWSMDFISWAKTLPYADELIFQPLEEMRKKIEFIEND